MSHTSMYKQKISDIKTFLSIAAKLGYEVERFEENTSVMLYPGNSVTAAARVHIKGWRYNVAITPDGQVAYDAFGTPKESYDRLGSLFQDYNVAVVEKNLPFDEIQNHYIKHENDGVKKMILEYE